MDHDIIDDNRKKSMAYLWSLEIVFFLYNYTNIHKKKEKNCIIFRSL